MAIKTTVQLPNNFGELSTISDAYIRVDGVRGTKHQIEATVNFYRSPNEASLPASRTISFAPTMNANFIQQAYEHLKALPEFAGAVDC